MSLAQLIHSDLDRAIVRNLLVVSPQETVLDALELMNSAHSSGSLPLETDGDQFRSTPICSSCVLVMENQNILGIFTERDVVRLSATGQSFHGLSIVEGMTAPIVTIQRSEFTDIFTPLNLLKRHRIRHLPVVDGQGQVEGLVTHESLQYLLETRQTQIVTLESENRVLLQHCTEELEQREQARTQELRASEARFRLLFEQAAVGVAQMSVEGQWLMVNHKLCEILGYTPTELMGLPCPSLIYPEDWPITEQQVQNLLTGAIDHYQLEKRYIHKNGSLIWVAATVSLMEEETASGTQRCLLAIIQDINDRKKAELQLHQALYRLQTHIDNAPIATIELNQDLQVVRWSRHAEEIFGWTASEVLGQTLFSWKWIFEADLDRVNRVAENLLQGKELRNTCQNRNYRKDGSVIECEWYNSLLSDETGQILSIQCLALDVTDRKQAERALRQSETNLLAAQQVAHIGSWEFDLATQEIKWSEELFRIFGLTPSHTLSYTDFLQRVHPLDRTALVQAIHEAMTQGTAYKIEHRIMRPDGTLRYLEGRGTVRRNASGEVTTLFGTALDITQRKAVELELRDSEQRYASLAAAAPVAIARYDLEGDCIYVNWQWCAMTGMPASEALGMGWAEHLHPEDRGFLLTLWRESVQNATDLMIEGRFLHPKGHQVWFYGHSVPEFDSEGNVRGFIAALTDISDRKRAEAALRDSEEKFRELAENISEVFFINSADVRQLLYISPGYERIWGRSRESIYQEPWSFIDAIHLDDRETLLATLDRQATGEAVQVQYRILRPDGEQRWIFARTVPIFGADGVLQRHVGIAEDMTDRKQAELELEASRQKLITAQTVAHVGNWDFDLATQTITWSEELFRIFGLDPTQPEPTYEAMVQFYHPEDRIPHQAAVDRLIAEGIPFDLDLRLLRPDGSHGVINAKGQAFRDAKGKIIRLFGTALDITDRKQSEAALRNSEAKFRRLTENVPGMIYRYEVYPDRTDAFSFVGPFCEAIYGVSVEQILADANALWSTIHSEDRAALHKAWADSQQNLTPLASEYRILSTDGQLKWVQDLAHPERQPDGTTIWDGVVLDITDRKQTEITLQSIVEGTASVRGEAFFQALAEQIAIALNVKCVFASRLKGSELETLVAYFNQAQQAKIRYHWVNTPCEITLREGMYLCSSGIQNRFPQDLDLQDLGVDSYCGIALRDGAGETLGILSILDSHPMPDIEQKARLLRIFGLRAATELEQLQATEAIQRLNESLEQRVQERTQALQQQTELLKTILQSMGDGLLVANTQGEIILHNPAAEEITGMGLPAPRPEEWQNFWGIYLPDGTPCPTHDLPLVQAMEGKSVDQMAVVLRNAPNPHGVYVEATARPFTDGSGQLMGAVAVFRDVTDRKQTETALRESEARFRAIVSAMPDLILRVKRDGTCLDFVMPGGEDAKHYIPVQSHIREALPPELLPLHLQNIADAIDTQSMQVMEHCLQKAGQLIYEEIRTVALSEDTVLRIVRDITDRKRYEEGLQRTNLELERATRMKDEFLANMSHELRTPLNAILGMSEGLQESIFGPLNERQLKALATIERSGQHLLDLITDILDLAKIESGKLDLHITTTFVKSLCEASLTFVKQMALKKHLNLQLVISDTIGEIEADDRRLRQVLINLMSNAVKFTLEGGSVRLEVQKIEAGTWIEFAVIDTGIGITPENLNHLFQTFVQVDSSLNRQYAGTGLGLALVRRIVELHHGTVSAQSYPGQGSCFKVCLPCTHREEGSDRSPPSLRTQPLLLGEPHAAAVLRSISPPSAIAPDPLILSPTHVPLILVAEDNTANMESISDYLTSKGYRLAWAKNGWEVIDLARSTTPDLILMDIQMPDLDGLEAIRRMRADGPLATVPIIALTALTMPGDRERCLAAGATAYLGKPFRLKALLKLIHEVFSMRESLQFSTAPSE